MPSESQKQFIPVPGCEPIEIVRRDRVWQAGGGTIRNGSHIVHEGLDAFLEFIGGCWRLAEYTVETVLASQAPQSGSAAATTLRCPSHLAADSAGNVYVAEPERNVVWRIDSYGLIAPLAGTGDRGFGGDGGPADKALLASPHGLAVDGQGNLYIADSFNHRIRKVDPTGQIETVVGVGEPGYGGDGGPAIAAVLRRPSGVALAAGGELLVADTGNNRIRRIDAASTITTLAGSGEMGFGGAGGPATEAALTWPRSIAADAVGNVYVADIRHFRVRRIDPQGMIRTIAGTGTPGYSGDGGLATAARLGWLGGLALDAAGNLYVTDRSNLCVRRIDSAGVIRTVAAAPRWHAAPSAFGSGEAVIAAPDGLTVDLAGNLYLADRSGHRVHKVTPDGTVTTIAGTGMPGYAGDGGPASEACLDQPCDLASDPAGNLYIADSCNNRIRKVDASGRIATAAGSGRWGHGMDDDPATDTLLDTPERVMAGLKGEFYLSGNDSGLDTANSRVYKVSPQRLAGTISTVARPGDCRYWPERYPVPDTSLDPDRLAAELAVGRCAAEWYQDLVRRIDVDGLIKAIAIPTRQSKSDGEPSPSVPSFAPCGIAADSTGTMYLADRDSGKVLRMHDNGSVSPVTRIAGGPGVGPTGREVDAWVEDTAGITLDANGNAYFVASKRVWKLDASGVVAPFAGTGEEGYWGDGGPATAAGLDGAAGLAADAQGNVYVTETRNRRVRRIDRSGIITTAAGTTASARSWRSRLPDSHMGCPVGLAVDSAGNVFVNDGDDDRIWKIDPSGAVAKISGTGEDPSAGDGEPSGVAVDAAGNVYVADAAHHRVRKIEPTGFVSTVAGTSEDGYSGDGGPATRAKLSQPSGIAVDGSGNLYVADWMWNVIRKVDTAGTITAFAGTGEEGFGGDGGLALEAKFWGPKGLALDREGNLYVADDGNRRIRRIDPSGIITTIAGTGETDLDGNRGPALESHFLYPTAVAVDSGGSVYVTESLDLWHDDPNWIRKVDPNGAISVFAGKLEPGYAGDGGPIADALFHQPNGVAFDSERNMYVADGRNARIRKIDPAGIVTTVAGCPVRPGNSGDGQASESELGYPTDVAVDPVGNVYVADAGDCRVRKIDSSGMITTLVDEGTAAKRSPIRWHSGNAMVLRNRISSNDPLEAPPVTPGLRSEEVTTDTPDSHAGRKSTGPKAGAGSQMPTAETLGVTLGTQPSLPRVPPMMPSSIAVDATGNVYVADRRGNRVIRIDPAGCASTVAGTGEPGYSGDGGPAVDARVDAEHVTVDAGGDVFVAGGNRVRRIDSSGTITTVAGDGSDRYSGDRGAGAAIGLSISGLAASPSGDLWVADRENRRIRVLRRCHPPHRAESGN